MCFEGIGIGCCGGCSRITIGFGVTGDLFGSWRTINGGAAGS